MQTKHIGTVNQFMFCMSDKFLYQNQQYKKIKKSWSGICTYQAFISIHQKYIITHTVQTRVLNVSFLHTTVRVPGDYCNTKYTSEYFYG